MDNNQLIFVTVHLNNYAGFKRTYDSIVKFKNKKHKFTWFIKDGKSETTTITKIKTEIRKINDDNYIKLFISEDVGVYDAMNQAILALPNQAHVLFLNSGDELSSNFIDFYNLDFESYDLIYSDTIIKNLETIVRAPFKIDFAYLLMKTINHQSYFIKAELLRKYPFQINYNIVADWVQLMEIFKNEKISTRKLDYPISMYEGGGISEKNDELRLQQRADYLKSIYSDWELESMMLLSRLQQRSWFSFIIKALNSPKRSKVLEIISKIN